MKKHLCSLAVIVLLFSALAGCGAQEGPAAPEREDREPSVQEPAPGPEAFSESTITAVSALDNTAFVWTESQLSELTRLLREGLQSPLPEEEAAALPGNGLRLFSLTTEDGELSADVLAGADRQGIVRLTTSGGASAAIRSPELAALLLKGLCVEGPVDQELLALVQPAIQDRIQQVCRQYNESAEESAQYLDGQVVQLEPIYREAGPGGEEFVLCSLDVALLCKHPENIQLFGGMWVDDQERMRDPYNWAYLAAEIKEGAAVRTAFLLGDEVDPYGGGETLRSTMMDALSREQTP